MADVIVVFTVSGVIISIGFLANVIFKKTGFPDVLFLIIMGIILGPLMNLFSVEDLLPVIPIFAALALMLILFQGGLSMEFYTVLLQSFRAAAIGFLYVIFAILFVSLFSHLIMGFNWLEGLILGSMTAGTDSVVIIPLISKMRVVDDVKAILSLESTVTDVLNIILVIMFLQVFRRGFVNFQEAMSSLVARLAVGIMLGAIVGIVWIKVLDVIKRQEYTYMLTLAALILCYAGTEFLGGSGALSALVFGITLGNYLRIKRLGIRVDFNSMQKLIGNIRNFQNEITFLVRALFFVILGLIYVPDLFGLLYAGIIMSVNLLLRYLAVKISTYHSALYKYRKFMTLMCGTGLANATLSLIVYNEMMAQHNFIASLYPLIITNIIIISNVVTSITPLILRGERKNNLD